MLNDLVGESSLGTFPRATWNNWLVVAKKKHQQQLKDIDILDSVW